ncbi:Alpha-glucosidase, partial [Bienertia sinuspersici]
VSINAARDIMTLTRLSLWWIDGKPYLSKVWPGPMYYPNIIKIATQICWVDEINRFQDLLPCDGLWIDMSEASNFNTAKLTSRSTLDNPPYKINNFGSQNTMPIAYMGTLKFEPPIKHSLQSLKNDHLYLLDQPLLALEDMLHIRLEIMQQDGWTWHIPFQLC